MLLISFIRLVGPLLLLLSLHAQAAGSDHAVGLVYHHVSTETPKSTSVTPRQFEAHMSFLKRQQFTVWPLGKIVSALRAGETIPDNTVAITFDDASLSVYEAALPIMRELGFPFTVFVSTESVNRNYGATMSWEQLAEIAAEGNEIGNHSHSHDHLVRQQEDESFETWRARVSADIERAQAVIAEKTGQVPTLFAYPYGEHSAALRAVVDDIGLVGVAQQSGAIGSQSDFLALPRFPIATSYAALSRVVTAIRARPLPVTAVEMSAEDDFGTAPELITLRLAEADYRLSQLACFSSNGDRLEIGGLPGDERQILFDLGGVSRAGRNKINCTAPVGEEKHAFYWYSHLWIQKRDDGSWYRE